MLSVGSRDGRKGVGFDVGGEMGETELEEGEASYYHDDDDEQVDPDIDLSYLDQKLHEVLGHFQKDFEGGVSAENLGAKFGGYGSFLPSYQRSPSIWSHPRSPQKRQASTAQKSPINLPSENAFQNPTIPVSGSYSLRPLPCSSGVQPGSTQSNAVYSAKSVGENSPKHDSVNTNDQKTLKVRIKVGPDNALARKNAAIYSGLGLDISPSSSLEDSPYGSGELSPDLQVAPDESPMTIIQMMTSFRAAGGYLLSPLPEALLCLPEKEKTFLKDSKPVTFRKGSQGISSVPPDDSYSIMRDTKEFKERRVKSVEKNEMSSLLKLDVDIETLPSRELVSNAMKISSLSASKGPNERSERLISGDTVNLISREPNKSSTKERASSLDSGTEEPLEFVATHSTTRNNERVALKGKQKSKVWEEKKASSHKDFSFDERKDEKSFGTFKVENDGSKTGRKDQSSGHVESTKQKLVEKATLCEQNAVKMPQGKEQLSGSKKKAKGSQSNGGPSVAELSKESSKLVPSVPVKEKKNSSLPGDIFSESKGDLIKYCKESNKAIGREPHKDSVGELRGEQLENGADSLEANYEVRPKDLKLKFEKETHSFVEKSKERSSGRKFEKPATSEAYPMAPTSTGTALVNGLSSEASLAPLAAPVVVKENWVGCDRCQKWRLLPYELNPASLPKNWLCSMLYWLPGMNKCSILEEETTKALNALYQMPIPENQNNLQVQQDKLTAGVELTDLNPQDQTRELSSHAMPSGRKKKHGGSKDTSNAASQTPHSHLPNSIKKPKQASLKSKSINNVSQSSLDSDPANKSGFQVTSKPHDFTVENSSSKQKQKHKLLEHYSDGGDYMEQCGKHPRTKSKREADKDDSLNSKKVKMESSQYSLDGWQSDHELTGKGISSNGFPAKLSGKKSQRHHSHSSSKDSKGDTRDKVASFGKQPKVHVNGSLTGEHKPQLVAPETRKLDKPELAAKKRKVKEWQESQVYLETLPGDGDHPIGNGVLKEEMSESEHRNEKKIKLSKSEGKEYSMNNVDSRTDKKGRVPKILLCTSDVGKRNVDGLDSIKKDLGYKTESSMAATSSSSKVSGSRKSKANFQEVKGSPVESVSSSPLRVSNSDKRTTTARRILIGKDDATNVGLSDAEDGGFDRPGKGLKASSIVQNNSSLESNRAAESLVLDPLQAPSDEYQDNRDSQFSGSKPKYYLTSNTSCGVQDDPFPSKLENINVNGGPSDTLDQHDLYLSDSRGKDLAHDQSHKPDIRSNHYHANGSSSPRKSGRVSSSGSKDKHRGDRVKASISNVFGEQDESSKAGGSYRYEADIDSRDRSPCHDRLRAGRHNGKPSKDEENYLAKKDSVAKWSSEGRRDSHQSKFGMRENSDVQGSQMVNKQQIDFKVKSGKSNLQNVAQVSSHDNERTSNRQLSEKKNQAVAVGRGKSVASADKQEMQTRVPQTVPNPNRKTRSDGLPGDVLGGDVKHLRKPDDLNGGSRSSLKHPAPNGTAGREADAPSPVRRDPCPLATIALKEAKDLKHTADRVKSGGEDLESTGLYFEAALKFLHGASLLEPVCAENAKHTEMTKSMSVYSETAGLCEFCAHEYEKQRDMASACLAYKCMEVAYMRVVYSKNFGACKDRHELQNALQVLPTGESPSSSASDVDNLNIQATMDKVTLAKSITSPQIAGNHVIVARNRPNFLRILNFAQDTNSAMEALRKSQNAFAAANASLEDSRYPPEGISSVKRVLEFSVHDVEGILRLVRVAMESLSR